MIDGKKNLTNFGWLVRESSVEIDWIGCCLFLLVIKSIDVRTTSLVYENDKQRGSSNNNVCWLRVQINHRDDRTKDYRWNSTIVASCYFYYYMISFIAVPPGGPYHWLEKFLLRGHVLLRCSLVRIIHIMVSAIFDWNMVTLQMNSYDFVQWLEKLINLMCIWR